MSPWSLLAAAAPEPPHGATLGGTLEVLALSGGGAWVLAGNFVGEGPVHAPPFEAVALELGALWLPGAEE